MYIAALSDHHAKVAAPLAYARGSVRNEGGLAYHHHPVLFF